MPNVEGSVRQGSATAGIHHSDSQLHGHAWLPFGDVGAKFLVVDVVRPFFLLPGKRAERRAREAVTADDHARARRQKTSSCNPVKAGHALIIGPNCKARGKALSQACKAC
jgi:hypothetical protein